MSAAIYPNDLFEAAKERAAQAGLLRRNGDYALAMYVAGVAVECMLRAYYPKGKEHDAKHDITKMFKDCELEKGLGDGARKQLRDAVQAVHLLWQNRYRFFSEGRLRAELKALEQHRRGVDKGADFLKVRCTDLDDACNAIITIGVIRYGK